MFEGIGNINDYIKTDSAAQKMAEKYREKTEETSQRMKMASSKRDLRMTSIMGKMRRGKKLSHSDLNYLRQKNPAVYQKAAAVQKSREDFEKKLKLCKDKESVRRLRASVTCSAVGSAVNAGSGAANVNGDSFSMSAACDASSIPNVSAEGNATVKAAAVTAQSIQQQNLQNYDTFTDNSTENSSQYSENDENRHSRSIQDFSDRNDINNYHYRSLSEAYRIYKKGLTYQKLPQKRKRSIRGNGIKV